MIPRRITPRLDESLDQFSVVALHGLRQVGKSTLAPRITRGYHEALRDLDIPAGKVVYSGDDSYAMASDAWVTGIAEAISGSKS